MDDMDLTPNFGKRDSDPPKAPMLVRIGNSASAAGISRSATVAISFLVPFAVWMVVHLVQTYEANLFKMGETLGALSVTVGSMNTLIADKGMFRDNEIAGLKRNDDVVNDQLRDINKELEHDQVMLACLNAGKRCP